MKKLLSLLLLLSFTIKAQDVTIGTQTWTSKNLNVGTYRNGDKIPQVQDKNAWAKLKTGAWCYYENKTANGKIFGKLYNWYAVNDPRGLSPTGYHIPTDAEWTILTDYLGGESPPNSQAGTKMRYTSSWKDKGNGTNASGFAGLAGGYRDSNGNFFGIGSEGACWNSSEYEANLAWYRYLSNFNRGVYRRNHPKVYSLAVRCIKD